MAVSDWSTTASNNTAAPPNGAPEGWAPSQVNDVIRQIMADVRSFYDGANTTNDSAANVGFKGIPQNAQNGSYTFALSDAGKSVITSTASGDTYTIPPNASVAFPVGTAITVVNRSSDALTIARGAGVSLYLGGTTTDANRTLTGVGFCVLYKSSTNEWIISGAGVS